MKSFIATLFILALAIGWNPLHSKPHENASKKEKDKKGWDVLFDGTDLEKWRGKSSEALPADVWKIEDGMLCIDKTNRGDIITKEQYSDFELVFEFNLTEGANSGIKYFVTNIKNSKTGKSALNGLEYQIIDDYNHPLIIDDPNGLSSTASVYLLYSPKKKKLNPAGEWNSGRIVVRGSKVEHWLNGKRVVKFVRGSRDFTDRKAATKFVDDEQYGEAKEGHILLTDHKDKVYYRNIKIRRL